MQIRLGRVSTLIKKLSHDSLKKDMKDKLNNNQSYPNAISHKNLKKLLNEAKKEILSIEDYQNNKINEHQELNDLIQVWEKTSQKIVEVLKNKDQTLPENMSPKSLLAFGAMGAHINMALQALKATEFEQ